MSPARNILAAVVLCLIAQAAEAACTTPFFHEEQFDGTFSQHVIADVNQDGFPDIIAAENGDVVIYPGNGTLTPATPVIAHDGNSVGLVITAYVNEDTQLDLITWDYTVSVLYGLGGFTFSGPLPISSTGSNVIKQIASGDFNGDGLNDVAGAVNGSLGVSLQFDSNGSYSGGSTVLFSGSVRDFLVGDFAGDGHLDLVIGAGGGLTLAVGKGDGTFWPNETLSYPSGRYPFDMEAADVDGDGDLDFVSTDETSVTVTVWRNTGTFDRFSAVTYSIRPAVVPGGSPRAKGLTLADFNGDEIIDIAAGGAHSGYLAVLTGNGDATFGAASFTEIDAGDFTFDPLRGSLRVLSSADFDLDGRIDIVGEQAWDGVFGIFQNTCGLADVEGEAPELISVGTNLEIPVLVEPEADGGPVPTGTVTLKNGDVVLDSGTLVNGGTLLETDDLPVGTHTLTIEYSGDAEFVPAVSEPMPVTVTTETTTTTLTRSLAQSTWGQPVTFTATVTGTSTAEELEGTIELVIDGVVAATGDAPEFAFTTETLPAGTHQIVARFLGSEDHPPSSSAPLTHTVAKASAPVTIRSEASFVGGETVIEAVFDRPYLGTTITGSLELYEGATLLGIIDAAMQPRIWTLNNLAMGTHYFRAVYSGDANVLADDSPVLAHTVLPIAAGLDARGGSNSVTVVWGPFPSGAVQARLLRSTGTGAFTAIGLFDAVTRTYVDPNVVTGTVYRYKVEYLQTGGAVLSNTNTDLARLATFTDEGPLAGRTIRAIHLTQIRDAVNALRAAAGLAPITLNVTGLVQATHVVQLRTAIDQARSALGVGGFAWSGSVAAGLPVRAVHVQQLRDAVR